jgi:hypothetical protein
MDCGSFCRSVDRRLDRRRCCLVSAIPMSVMRRRDSLPEVGTLGCEPSDRLLLPHLQHRMGYEAAAERRLRRNRAPHAARRADGEDAAAKRRRHFVGASLRDASGHVLGQDLVDERLAALSVPLTCVSFSKSTWSRERLEAPRSATYRCACSGSCILRPCSSHVSTTSGVTGARRKASTPIASAIAFITAP